MEKERNVKVLEWLSFIDPALLSYQDWLNVGMGLKYEGYEVEVWDDWSRGDPTRYHEGDCFRKWESFKNQGVTGGTIYQLAIEKGYYLPFEKDEGHALEWDSVISASYRDSDYKIIDTTWVENKDIQEPKNSLWKPHEEIIKYLETLFEADEKVNYVMESTEIVDKKTGDIKYAPTKGSSSRTRDELVASLRKYEDDLASSLGSYNDKAGAWIRFNPVDGKGVNNENVTAYRYGLVECDNMELSKQNAILRELELPIATLVYSGKKSIHAVVRIEAPNYSEYQKRIEYLYKVCKKNGLNVDTANKNPSRLSRLCGIWRNGRKQFLIDTNIGKKSWEEWFTYIEDLNDDLPDPERLIDNWRHLPPLADELIEGVLRQGHKMLIAGASKAGKSFALIEMCIAIAEGKKWLNWKCKQGKVLYVNLELDRVSCLHRFKDVYDKLNIPPNNIDKIDIWNLRGKSIPLDKLAPKLIRRSAKSNYLAVIIDPIYKVITGDENSADKMAHFTNQFDKIATELSTSVIYCHHHSKGTQVGKKSMDRASGSGVFARDPDALIDLIELELDQQVLDNEILRLFKTKAFKYLEKANVKGIDYNAFNTLGSSLRYCEQELNIYEFNRLKLELEEISKVINVSSAWRVDGILREFPKFKEFDIWFKYPLHEVDEYGILKDSEPFNDIKEFAKLKDKYHEKNKEKKQEKKENELEIAYSNLEVSDEKEITLGMLADELGVSKKTIKRRMENNKNFKVEYPTVGSDAIIVRVNED